jgi:hypothetical protein
METRFCASSGYIPHNCQAIEKRGLQDPTMIHDDLWKKSSIDTRDEIHPGNRIGKASIMIYLFVLATESHECWHSQCNIG